MDQVCFLGKTCQTQSVPGQLSANLFLVIVGELVQLAALRMNACI